jgi:hypothetical protein
VPEHIFVVLVKNVAKEHLDMERGDIVAAVRLRRLSDDEFTLPVGLRTRPRADYAGRNGLCGELQMVDYRDKVIVHEKSPRGGGRTSGYAEHRAFV